MQGPLWPNGLPHNYLIQPTQQSASGTGYTGYLHTVTTQFCCTRYTGTYSNVSEEDERKEERLAKESAEEEWDWSL